MTNNEMKLHTLKEMANLVADFAQKLQVLESLDHDNTTSGAFEIHDQLTSLSATMGNLDKTVSRARSVVVHNNEDNA
tara:strand:+ start:576 stop:806 length:231 start_codon:yes stop_codon:yes gene_type:complete